MLTSDIRASIYLAVRCTSLIRSGIARFMWSTWDSPGSYRPQMGPMLAPWNLLSGVHGKVYRACVHSAVLYGSETRGPNTDLEPLCRTDCAMSCWICGTKGPLQWRHNERNGVSNHQPHDCLPSRLFRRRSKKTSKVRITGLCAGNSPVTGEFPAQRASSAKHISIWWRHRARWNTLCLTTQQLGRSPKVVALFLLQTLVAM